MAGADDLEEQTIRLSALTPSAGSAPVNIPKGGCHQSSQFSPHSPCAVLSVSHPVNEAATGVDTFSFNNQVIFHILRNIFEKVVVLYYFLQVFRSFRSFLEKVEAVY